MSTFIEVTGAIAFWTVREAANMHPRIIEMWAHFRAFALYFLQYRPGQHTRNQIRAAQGRLFKFAAFAEEHLEGRLLTVLLHRAVVHIPEQVIDGLPGAYMREDWGERCVRRTKGRITGHATNRAAQASAATCLTEMGLRICKNQHPDIDAPLIAAQQKTVRHKEDAGDSFGAQLHHLKPAYMGHTGDEVSHLVSALISMSNKVRNRGHQLHGPLAVAGVLTEEHITGYREAGLIKDAAEVFYSDTASIQWGAFLIRTDKGCAAFGRTRTDQYAYIPFMAAHRQNPCVMKISQLLLVKRQGMGWPNGECRLAVGTLYDSLSIRKGAGLEAEYNDDPSREACVVPRALFASRRCLECGYLWAVHMRQINCPVAHIPGTSGDTFLTLSKLGYHGRKDLLTND